VGSSHEWRSAGFSVATVAVLDFSQRSSRLHGE